MKRRLDNIDIVRGLVMIIMALDHVRDYVHAPAIAWMDPMDPSSTTVATYFTRWITHFCAPVFVMLAGMSAAIAYGRSSDQRMSRLFLALRGAVLILAEVTIVAIGWNFSLTYPVLLLQVIWAIGWSMIVLAAAQGLGSRIVLGIGVSIIVFHNTLDPINSTGSNLYSILWQVLHDGAFHTFGGRTLMIGYPILPWIGVMFLGYGLGDIVSRREDHGKKLLRWLGLGMMAGFVVLRLVNVYGDPSPWSVWPTVEQTIMSFLDCEKYPPSLLYVCMTLGPAFVLLSLLPVKGAERGLSSIVRMFGRVPMFYYVVHIWLIHALAWLLFFLAGHPAESFGDIRTFGGVPFGGGFDLWVVYAVWIVTIVMLWPLCRWYDGLKRQYPTSTLLRLF